MKEIYSWVPWFQELAKNIAEGGENYLLENSKKVAWYSEDHSEEKELGLHRYGSENVDPFSFIYTLSSRSKNHDSRKRIYQSVGEIFEISQELDFDNQDSYYFPTPPQVNTLFHQNGNGNPGLIWNIFRSAVRGIKHISSQEFEAALTIGRVGTQKLTQVLFLVNPVEFLPIDRRTETLKLFEYVDPIAWENYLKNIDLARHFFPRCELYEVNLFAYLLNSIRISVNDKFFQIATNNFDKGKDHFDEFDRTNCVYTLKDYDSLKSPKKGDIILARSSGEGRGIGIVYRNDYANYEIDENSKIHVVWLNKNAENRLGESSWHSTIGFGNAKHIRTYFQESDAYRPTFEMLDKLKFRNILQSDQKPIAEEENGESKETQDYRLVRHSLNKILYGPPGSGKTYSTTRVSVEICDGRSDGKSQKELQERFRELRDSKHRIEFVTFHQSYGYEEFVEGLRPKTPTEGNTEGASGFRLEPEPGVLKRIAERARQDRDNPYVLIIDEINRANISKVLGELVTLLEEDKRKGAENEVSVTLPYSGEAFTLPSNLYILGTMNTADRSIALLDTALRRRFDFVEMPPRPKLLENVNVDGVNLPQVLKTINKRLEYLRDRDHLVGHAWFMGCNNLDDVGNVMRNKIIPLLAEYFYDDWIKVRAVLGGGNDFISAKRLYPPPNLGDAGVEDRYRWTVKKPPYPEQAYDNLINKPPSKQESGE